VIYAQIVRKVQRKSNRNKRETEEKGSKPDNNDNASDASSYPDVDSSRNKGWGCWGEPLPIMHA
jgi:hypothetical protein